MDLTAANARAKEAVDICVQAVEESFRLAVRQIQYRNPKVELNLNGIDPFYEFHGGKLVAVVDDRQEEPPNTKYQLAPLPEGQSMGPSLLAPIPKRSNKEGTTPGDGGSEARGESKRKGGETSQQRYKTEVNLRRLLAAAPQQQNQAKLVHYVATLREQLEQLAEERTPEGLPRISKAMLNDYSEKIEAIASKLVNQVPDIQVFEEDTEKNFVKENPSEIEEKEKIPLSSGLRRRPVPSSSTEDKAHEPGETDQASPVKLDAVGHAYIEKHRKLQEDLTDEMVVLAKQLKESSLTMNRFLQNTKKVQSQFSYFALNPVYLTAKWLYEMVLLHVSHFRI
ncbi:hypothetical protein RJT34_32972 [Clitoria ternatea]|uniref:Uncharacterized protein n=1 Tax=Clitoria ternatea TaxID=43366 RepID=A0AAN9F4Z9_CLITE